MIVKRQSLASSLKGTKKAILIDMCETTLGLITYDGNLCLYNLKENSLISKTKIPNVILKKLVLRPEAKRGKNRGLNYHNEIEE